MKPIKFMENHNNKLDCDIFSTIRRSNPEKMQYYKEGIGKVFEVMLNKELYCKARLFQVTPHPSLRCIPNGILMLDVGTNDVKELENVFKKFQITWRQTPVMSLWFQRIKDEE